MGVKMGPFILREEHRLRGLRRKIGSKKEAVQNTRELQNDEPHDYIRAYIHTYIQTNAELSLSVCLSVSLSLSLSIYIYIYRHTNIYIIHTVG